MSGRSNSTPGYKWPWCKKDSSAATKPVDVNTPEFIKELIEEVRNDQDHHEVEFSCVDCHVEGVQQWEACKKNPGHQGFHYIKDLSVDDLPIEWRSQGNFDFVKEIAKRTVRLHAWYTSTERAAKDPFAKLRGTKTGRVGTGHAYENQVDRVKCMFKNCSVDPNPHDVLTFNISTAKHVIYNDEEALKTTVDFFYDCQDCDNHEECKKRVVKARGLEVVWTDSVKDGTLMKCATHDLSLPEKIQSNNLMIHNLDRNHEISFIVSHAHGCQKQVTFGKVHKLLGMNSGESVVESDGNLWFRRSFTKALYNTPTCPGTSGAAVYSFRNDGNEVSITHALHSRCCQTDGESTTQFNSSNVGNLHTRDLPKKRRPIPKRDVLDFWKAECHSKFINFLGDLIKTRARSRGGGAGG